MASDPTPTPPVEQPTPAAPLLLDPAVKRSWMRASRVTVVLTVAFCLLLTGLRWIDAQRQARAVGSTVVNLVDAAQGVTSVTLPAVEAAVEPQVAVQAIAFCPAGQPCETLFAREEAQACTPGLSLTALCTPVRSLSRPEDTVRVTYSLGATWVAAAEQSVACLLLMVGVLWAFAKVRTSRAPSASSQVGGGAGEPGGTTQKSNEHDALTGLLNRVAFEAAVKRHNETGAATASGEADGCLMYFDLDRFKAINDTHGHIAGDLVLKAVAGRLRYTLGNGALIGRLGGDEFAALLTDVSTHATIQQMGRVLIEQVSKPIQMGGLTDAVGLSIGAFMLKRGELAVGDILHRADLAMYEAKRGGRGRMMFFEEAMDAASRSRAQIQIDLNKAIQDREMFMVYQPQVDAFDSIRGVESLVRWRHPTRGLVAPDEFISIAEQTGLIVPLGKMIIELVCADLVALRAQRLALPYVSVNLSLRQLADPAFVDEVQEALSRHGLSPTDLEFEITESTAMVGQAAKETATLKRLAEMGFRLAIDDFGTGYSSLGRLLDLKVDKLKIDRVFVAAITKPNFDPALLELMISLAKRMGIKSVAEGVENVDQVVWLRQAGCQMMQGDLYSRPMNHSQLISWLRLQEGDNDFDEGVWSPTMTMEESGV